jgi:ATP-dependent metalloprotease
VARGTPGFSGAELENLVNQAAVKASKEGSTMVTLQHIEWAKECVAVISADVV